MSSGLFLFVVLKWPSVLITLSWKCSGQVGIVSFFLLSALSFLISLLYVTFPMCSYNKYRKVQCVSSYILTKNSAFAHNNYVKLWNLSSLLVIDLFGICILLFHFWQVIEIKNLSISYRSSSLFEYKFSTVTNVLLDNSYY